MAITQINGSTAMTIEHYQTVEKKPCITLLRGSYRCGSALTEGGYTFRYLSEVTEDDFPFIVIQNGRSGKSEKLKLYGRGDAVFVELSNGDIVTVGSNTSISKVDFPLL